LHVHHHLFLIDFSTYYKLFITLLLAGDETRTN